MTTPRGNLPPITFADKSVTDVESSVITTYESISGRTLAPADPVRLFLVSIASIIVNQRSIIDFAAKQNLLSYVTDEYVDYLGELVDVTRLPATPALTTIRYTLSAPQAGVYSIPAGSELTVSGIKFATTEILNIQAGDITGEVAAQCETAGTVGNGFLPGQIKTMVAPLPFVQSAVNITTSAGGAEQEGVESMVDRIRLAPASFTTAGPVDAYVYWALTANPSIIDVAVSSPTPGVVDVRVLLTGGALPTPDVITQVENVLSADDIRPLTDDVQVQAPTGVSYDVDVKYWISSDNASSAVAIQNAVNQAVEDYKTWQKTKIGRDINPDELLCRIKNAGAKRAVITGPVFAALDDTQIAQDNTTNVTYQGLEDA